MRNLFFSGFCIVISFIVSSCSSVPGRHALQLPRESYPGSTGPVLRRDVVHALAPGETLWRLSKMYDVEMDDIIRANDLKDPRDLEMGQRILVPRAAPIRPVIALFPSDKWKYIIIHHSATDEGNALDFNALHKRKGWDGVGYDFVIDNGTNGKEDGQIEVSPRWIKQKTGAHCLASNMNSKGIGICLVGNFSKERVSQKQMSSLVYLVNILKKYYKIPRGHIMGHGQVPEAKTECPGKYFPWKEFDEQVL